MAYSERQSMSTQPGPEPELHRAINGRLLYFYVLGDVLGSGIYALVGVMAAQVGGAFWMSFAIGVSAAMLTGLAYAELITKYPRAGGASSFAHRAFDIPLITFLVTFAMVAASLSSAGALSLAFSGYFLELLDPVLSLPVLATAAVFIVLLAVVNYRGISESVKANVAMTITEVTGLVIVLVIGAVVIFRGDADFGRPFEFNDGNPALLVLTGSVLAFFAMSGFENSANVAEEVQNPSKVFPRALLGGMITAGVVYLVIAFLASLVTSAEVLGDSDVALLEVVRTGMPDFPGWLFAAIACVAITNTCLVQLITMSRIMYGMGREDVVPRVFSKTHHTRRTPWVAIIATTAVVLVIMLSVGEGGVSTLANATVQFLLAVFAVVCVCGLVLRRDAVDHEHYEAPKALLGLGVLVNLALFGYVVVTDIRDLVRGDLEVLESSTVVCGILLAVGLVLYVVNGFGRRKLDAAPPGVHR
jgi:basic amino acid/polyamine antiporter, APA family